MGGAQRGEALSLFGQWREPRLDIKALRETARGQECTFRVPNVCNSNKETTVWAHSNKGRHGKGVGLKSHDPFGAFACSACHDWYDNKLPNVSADAKDEAFELARDRTLYLLFRDGKLKVMP